MKKLQARITYSLTLTLLLSSLLGLILMTKTKHVKAGMRPTSPNACVTDPVVANNADSGAGSLRQAIADACDGSTITFAATVVSPITLTSGGQLLIDGKGVNIQGPGTRPMTISGNHAVRVFQTIDRGLTIQVTLSNLTIADGATGQDPGAPGVFANGIHGTVNIINCTISGNSNVGGPNGGQGGGVFNNGTMNITNSTISGNSATQQSDGGAGIFNNNVATLNLTNCTISGNSTTNRGGGIRNNGGTINVKNTIIAGNTANIAGPDVFNNFNSLGYDLIGKSDGSTGLTNGMNNDQVGSIAAPLDPKLGPLQDNGGPTFTMALLAGSPAIDQGKNSNALTTDQRGAGFARTFDDPATANATAGDGTDIGAFELQHVSFTVTTTDDHDDGQCTSGDCTLREAINAANAAALGAGISFAPAVTGAINLGALGALPALDNNIQIQGPGANVLSVQRSTADGTPNFSIFTINRGKTVAISGLTIAKGHLDQGINNGGAGILNRGMLTLNNCTVSGNSEDAGNGGGIENRAGISDGAVTLTINNSTISGNSASMGGGGIRNVGIFQGNTATLTINNSTISGNSANFGGGILNFSTDGGTATLIINNSTVSGNSADLCGGIYNIGAATIGSSIIARNTASDSPDVQGAFTSNGFNLIGDASNSSGFTQPTDLIGLDPKLELDGMGKPLLKDNGGPTKTIALLLGSPAINAGNNTGAPATDQRGIARPQQGTVDIGAFESRGFTLAVTSGNNQSTQINTAFASSLVVTASSSFGEPVSGGSVTFTSPGSGASAALSGTPATILANGQASITAMANGIPNSYLVTAAANGASSVNFNLTNLCQPITVNPMTAILPGGTVGASYSQQFSQSGGNGGITWSITPPVPGLTLDSTGKLSGTPSQTGTFNFTIQAQDMNQCPGSQAYQVTINCPQITATVSGGGAICRNCLATVSVNFVGGTAPYTVTLTNGGGTLQSSSLPINFMVSPATVTTYQVQSASDAYGCLAMGSGSATVIPHSPTDPDFNGDGKDDIAGRNLTTGGVQVGLSNGAQFLPSTVWGTWNLNYDLHFADVNGDGKTDIVGRNKLTGEVQVGLSDGTQFLPSTSWGSWSLNYDLHLADLNGDGKADIIGRHQTTGNVQVGLSNGTQFLNSTVWGSWNLSYDVHFADVNGDGQADLVGRHQTTGDVQVGLSNGTQFQNSTSWGSWSLNYDLHLADVNGDGKADIVGRHQTTGNVQVGLSNGSQFLNSTSWGTWNLNYDLHLADVNGDGKADIVGRHQMTGNVQVGLSNGSQFLNSTMWGTWNLNYDIHADVMD